MKERKTSTKRLDDFTGMIFAHEVFKSDRGNGKINVDVTSKLRLISSPPSGSRELVFSLNNGGLAHFHFDPKIECPNSILPSALTKESDWLRSVLYQGARVCKNSDSMPKSWCMIGTSIPLWEGNALALTSQTSPIQAPGPRVSTSERLITTRNGLYYSNLISMFRIRHTIVWVQWARLSVKLGSVSVVCILARPSR